MRNFYASNSAHAIPYRPELRICFEPFAPIKGRSAKDLTTTGAILLQQLDYWFSKYPSGFYKFMEPPQTGHRAYRPGDSWTEELYFSRKEFTTAFDQIGIAYKSKGQFDEAAKAGDVFQGRFYCSYYDRIERITWYYRNHPVVDAYLDKAAATALKGVGAGGKQCAPSEQSGKSGNDRSAVLGNDRSVVLDLTDGQFEYTETTHREQTTKTTTTSDGGGSSGVGFDAATTAGLGDNAKECAREVAAIVSSHGLRVSITDTLIKACKGKNPDAATLNALSVVEHHVGGAQIKSAQAMLTRALQQNWAPSHATFVNGKLNGVGKLLYIQQYAIAAERLGCINDLSLQEDEYSYTVEGQRHCCPYSELPAMPVEGVTLQELWAELQCQQVV